MKFKLKKDIDFLYGHFDLSKEEKFKGKVLLGVNKENLWEKMFY
jgi:hypothetical protein